jgi:hypothetical protein
MKKEAYEETTIKATAKRLKHLQKNCLLADPESTKIFVANKKCSNAFNECLIEVYDIFMRSIGQQWNKPFYARYDKLAKIPTEEKVNMLISQATRRMALILSMSRDLGSRPVELTWLKVSDINLQNGIVSITGAKHTVGRNGKAPAFIGEEAIKYIKRYLLTRRNLTPESLLFTVRNSPNKKINTKDVSKRFTSTAQEYQKKANPSSRFMLEKPNDLKLYSIVYFYREKAKDYLKELEKYTSVKNDEFYRKLYEEKALSSLEIEPPPTREIQQLKQRLDEIEHVIFPRSSQITDPRKWLEEFEEWKRKNPVEAKEQQEREEYWLMERDKEFEAFQRIMAEDPEGLINYLQNLKEKIDVIEIIVRKQLRT